MTRRGKGEGSIYLRADGRWEAAAWVPTSSGRRRRVRAYGSTRTEAHRKLLTVLKSASDGVPAPDRAWRVGEYLDYWLPIAKRDLAPTTYLNYRGLIENHLKPGLGGKSLTGLTVLMLQQHLDDQLEHGVSARTIQKQRTVLSAALRQAMQEELVVRNVAHRVRTPRWERSEVTPWTQEQLVTFLRAARSDPLYPAFALLALYGLRSGEVRGIRWSDIDWTRGVINVRQQVQRYDGSMHQRELKTRASRRDLPLIGSARAVLREHLLAQQDNPASSQLVFRTRFDNSIESGNLLRSFYRVTAAAGLPKIKIHHLRHTAATLLKNAKVPDRDIQLILGHSNIQTTIQIYQHADIEGQRKGLETLDRQLSLPPLLDAKNISRQNQPSILYFRATTRVHNFGQKRPKSASERLVFRTAFDSIPTCLTEVTELADARRNVALLGGVAVMFSRQVK